MQMELARELVALARAIDKPEWELAALDKLLYGTITAGDLDAARRLARAHRVLAQRVGQPLFHVLDLQAHALLAAGEGRLTEAESLAERAEDAGRLLSDDTTAGGYGVLMFGIRRTQGRLEEARPVVEAVARLGRESETWRPALAVLHAELGMRATATQELADLVRDDLASVPRDALWPAALSYLADTCALTAAAAHAAVLYRHLLPYRGLVIQVGHFLGAHGAADRHLGSLAALDGRPEDAAAHFEAALGIDTAARMPVWLMATQLAYGTFLARLPDAASRRRGRALLGSAAEIAAQLVLPLRTAATDPPDRPAPGAASSTDPGTAPAADVPTNGIGELTDRELQVLALLAEGHSNRAIAERLHISHHTAANHVRAILHKTGLGNRTEAAAWAVRTGHARQ